jgi:hypothetical protein
LERNYWKHQPRFVQSVICLLYTPRSEGVCSWMHLSCLTGFCQKPFFCGLNPFVRINNIRNWIKLDTTLLYAVLWIQTTFFGQYSLLSCVWTSSVYVVMAVFMLYWRKFLLLFHVQVCFIWLAGVFLMIGAAYGVLWFGCWSEKLTFNICFYSCYFVMQ